MDQFNHNLISFYPFIIQQQTETIAEVVLSDNKDFNNTIKSSLNGFKTWSEFTPLKRSRILSKYKNLIEKDIDNMAKIVSTEHGKTKEDALGSITRGLEVVEFSCGIPHLLKGDYSQNVGTNIDSWSIRQPLGITAGITLLIFLQWFQCGCINFYCMW